MNRKGFTLVEMLIVIVIIGILAAAILPNLLGARDKANDTARRSELSNMIAPLTSFAGNNGSYPAGCKALSALSGDLKNDIEKIPSDPNSNNLIESDVVVGAVKGQYMYCGIERNEIPESAFALIARVSDTNVGNYKKSDGAITTGSDYSGILRKTQSNKTGEYLVIVKA